MFSSFRSPRVLCVWAFCLAAWMSYSCYENQCCSTLILFFSPRCPVAVISCAILLWLGWVRRSTLASSLPCLALPCLAEQVLQVFVQQTLITSYHTSNCTYNDVLGADCCPMGGTMYSDKNITGATQTLGDHDPRDCLSKHDLTRYMRHALVIR